MNWVEATIRKRGLAGQVLQKLRRFYLGTFRKDYVAQAIRETREGDCHRCGRCCEFLFRCPFLGRDSQSLPYCRIYGDLRPYNCRNYPFDDLDSEVPECGYRFKPRSGIPAPEVISEKR